MDPQERDRDLPPEIPGHRADGVNRVFSECGHLGCIGISRTEELVSGVGGAEPWILMSSATAVTAQTRKPLRLSRGIVGLASSSAMSSPRPTSLVASVNHPSYPTRHIVDVAPPPSLGMRLMMNTSNLQNTSVALRFCSLTVDSSQ